MPGFNRFDLYNDFKLFPKKVHLLTCLGEDFWWGPAFPVYFCGALGYVCNVLFFLDFKAKGQKKGWKGIQPFSLNRQSPN